MQNEEIKALVNGELFINAINTLLALNLDLDIRLPDSKKGNGIWERYKTYPKSVSSPKADVAQAKTFISGVLASQFEVLEVRWPVQNTSKKVFYVEYSNSYRISVVFGIHDGEWLITGMYLIEIRSLIPHSLVKIKI